MDPVPGFPPHASSPARRLEGSRRFRGRGILTQATVSPLLPLADPEAFAHQARCRLRPGHRRPLPDRRRLAERLADQADDLRPSGSTGRVRRMEQAGRSSGRSVTCWPACWEKERVLVGCDGFNAVGGIFAG